MPLLNRPLVPGHIDALYRAYRRNDPDPGHPGDPLVSQKAWRAASKEYKKKRKSIC